MQSVWQHSPGEISEHRVEGPISFSEGENPQRFEAYSKPNMISQIWLYSQNVDSRIWVVLSRSWIIPIWSQTQRDLRLGRVDKFIRNHLKERINLFVRGTQTGSYQTGSYQKGRFIPPKPKLLYVLLFDTTPFICLRIWSQTPEPQSGKSRPVFNLERLYRSGKSRRRNRLLRAPTAAGAHGIE